MKNITFEGISTLQRLHLCWQIRKQIGKIHQPIKVEFHQPICRKQYSSLWYGGLVVSIKVRGCVFAIHACGDIYATLYDKSDGTELLYVKDKSILECKTAHYDMQFKWANGAVPRHYELQVRHYMSVMNIDVAFIACLFSNNENDFVWQKIERDLEEEENTIMELSAFWNNHVMARVEPPLVEKPDAVLESLRRYFGPADKSEPTVDLDRKFVVNLKEILTLKEEKRALDAQVKALETRIKSLYAPIVEEMGTACKGTCEQGGECFKVSYNPLYREGISKDRLSALRAQYPDIYDEFVDQTESRIFKVVKSAIA